MSTAKRLISGSAASWVQIGINMLTQIALVPLYLTYWTVETYGVWLAVQALVTVLATLDKGHQAFLGFEFLRIGRENTGTISMYLWSGIVMALIIGLFEILLIVFFLISGLLPTLLGESVLLHESLIRDAGLVLLLQGIAWLICGSVGGLLVRVLSPFGYYPRMAWWGVFSVMITSAAPAIALCFGADLLTTGIVLAAATLAYNIPMYIDMIRLLHKEKIFYNTHSFRLGWNNFLTSLALSGKDLLENARQQGVRLVLAPLSGASGLAVFSTMRTGANVAMQGLNTITNPLMPELMRFLHQKDQVKSEAAFGTVWIVVIAIMAPAVVCLQAFIGPLYEIWTKGKIEFDPMLFAILSLGVLVYAVAQPAIAIVTGNNLLKPQLILSSLAAILVVGGMFIMVPLIGIIGTGIALLLAELAAAYGYIYYARRWLKDNGLQWPEKSSFIAWTSVFIAALAMALMIGLPEKRWYILVLFTLLLYWNLWRYWKTLSSLATMHVEEILKKIPLLKKIV